LNSSFLINKVHVVHTPKQYLQPRLQHIIGRTQSGNFDTMPANITMWTVAKATSLNTVVVSVLLTASLCRYYRLPVKPIINQSNVPNVPWSFHFENYKSAGVLISTASSNKTQTPTDHENDDYERFLVELDWKKNRFSIILFMCSVQVKTKGYMWRFFYSLSPINISA